LDEEFIEKYYEKLVTPTPHPLPEMALMFRGMLEQCNGSPKTFTADHLSFLLREFMPVGLNTVDSWQLCRSSDVLLNQIGRYKVSQPVTRAFKHRAENPFANSPVVVRWSLLGVQFGGVVDRIICGVIPSLINKGTSPDMISFKVYCWMIESMLHPFVTNLDDRLLLHSVVSEHCSDFIDYVDVNEMQPDVKAKLLGYRPFGFPREVHLTMPNPAQDRYLQGLIDDERERAEIRVLQDEQMRVIGLCLDPFDVATDVTLDEDGVCALCQEVFEACSLKISMQLKCTHILCFDCLHSLINAKYEHVGVIPCPCCRAPICPRRPLERLLHAEHAAG
jgi:hypothetical protein